jgi:hypothetical protein
MSQWRGERAIYIKNLVGHRKGSEEMTTKKQAFQALAPPNGGAPIKREL